MEIRQKYRLRVETCIGTIIDVHKRIQCASESRKILDQFEALRKAVTEMDMALVSERDIAMVEEATNALLCGTGRCTVKARRTPSTTTPDTRI